MLAFFVSCSSPACFENKSSRLLQQMLSFCEGHLETSRYKQPIKIKFSTSEAVTLELQLRQFNNFVKKTYVNSASRIIQIDQSFFEPSKLVATIEHWLLLTFFYRVWFLRFRPPYEIFGIIRLSAALPMNTMTATFRGN